MCEWSQKLYASELYKLERYQLHKTFRMIGSIQTSGRGSKNTRVFIILSLRRTGNDMHVSLHKGFKIRLAGIVPVFLEFTILRQKREKLEISLND